MTDHLPECPFGGDTDYSWLDECICDNLRACEARVREVYESSDDYTLGIAVGMHNGWLGGHAAALDAARDAVAVECHHDDPGEWCVYTAAIDALKEKP